METMVPSGRIKPRYAHFGKIAFGNQILDSGLSLWFPGPHSYTGEDMLEFHVHGGTAVVSSILKALGSIPHVRMAEPGEFSRRAFDHGKLDLTSLEGIADLINAETEAQRKLAVRQAQGELYQLYESWRVQLIRLRAHIEAVIDFSEEENIEDGVYDEVYKDAQKLAKSISAHINDQRQGEIMRSGVTLSIVGPPNSGKSTLLNKLAQRQVAIVSPIAGTTRDIIETTLDIGGYPVVVRDTAGLRDATADIIEQEGIRRAMESAKTADIRICMIDARQARSSSADVLNKELLNLPHTFTVLNKIDLYNQQAANGWDKSWDKAIRLSCATMEGWDSLMQAIAGDIRQTWETSDSHSMPLTKERHRQHLQQCLEHLHAFAQMNEDMVVLGAEELRQASQSLGRITGKVGIEDVLDALFSRLGQQNRPGFKANGTDSTAGAAAGWMRRRKPEHSKPSGKTIMQERIMKQIQNRLKERQKTDGKTERAPRDEEISAPMINLVSEDGVVEGVHPLTSVLSRMDRELHTLVMVDQHADPPTCKIYSRKLLYEREKQARKQVNAQNRKVKQQIIVLRSNIGEHDLEIKCNRIIGMLKKGRRVTVQVEQVKNAHSKPKDVGELIMKKVEEYSSVSIPPSTDRGLWSATVQGKTLVTDQD
ncbi:mitochondrial splicing system protein [Coemansia sp. RSA 2336]|nr:mitochondrial splicing system protein [Coemansia sp. RSA 2336]